AVLRNYMDSADVEPELELMALPAPTKRVDEVVLMFQIILICRRIRTECRNSGNADRWSKKARDRRTFKLPLKRSKAELIDRVGRDDIGPLRRPTFVTVVEVIIGAGDFESARRVVFRRIPVTVIADVNRIAFVNLIVH